MKQKMLLLLIAVTYGSLSAMAYHTQNDVDDENWKRFSCDFFTERMAFNYLSHEDRTVEVTYMWLSEMSCDQWIYEAETLVIPEKVTYEGEEYTVAAIGSSAFTYSRIKHIVIPPTVREIKWRAFSHVYELEELVIPNTVKVIGDEVFAGTEMNLGSIYPKVVIFPEEVESIGTGLFAWRERGWQMSLPGNITEVPKNTFYRGLLKEWKNLPESVEVIGPSAFYGNCFESISLPNGLKEIWSGAFERCNDLKSVTIPASVTFIGRYAFSQASDYWGSDVKEECGLETMRVLSLPFDCELKFTKKTVLIVPAGTKELFRKAWNVSPETEIKEDPDVVVGINIPTTNTSKADNYFNLQGQRLESAPRKGVYIQNGKKVVMK